MRSLSFLLFIILLVSAPTASADWPLVEQTPDAGLATEITPHLPEMQVDRETRDANSADRLDTSGDAGGALGRNTGGNVELLNGGAALADKAGTHLSSAALQNQSVDVANCIKQKTDTFVTQACGALRAAALDGGDGQRGLKALDNYTKCVHGAELNVNLTAVYECTKERNTSAGCAPGAIGCSDTGVKPTSGRIGDGGKGIGAGLHPTADGSPTNADGSPAGGAGSPGAGSVAHPTQGEVQGDLAKCQQEQQSAQTCCNSPVKCSDLMSPSDQAKLVMMQSKISSGAGSDTGLGGKQTSDLASDGADLNAAFAGVCLVQQKACKDDCGQLKTKYDSIVVDCNQSGSCGSMLPIYQSAANTIGQKNSSCMALSSKANAMTAQSVKDKGDSGLGDLTSLLSSMAPESKAQAESTSSGDPYGCASNPMGSACTSCSANPNSPGCRSLEAQAQQFGKAGFRDSQDPTGPIAPTFNSPGDQTGMAPIDSSANVKPNPTVPNGGGQIGDPGKNQPLDQKRVAAAGAKALDVDQGLRSGGGYQQANGNADAGPGGGFAGYGGPSGNRDPASDPNALDLKKYLPGNPNDPNRRLGGMSAQSAEIGGRFGDIWKKISDRFQEKCRLGELVDCR